MNETLRIRNAGQSTMPATLFAPFLPLAPFVPVALVALAASLPLTSVAAASGDAAKGKATYAQRCASCHSIEYNGAGPAHHGVFGRKAGTVPNFAYSPALKASGVTWTNETLEKWLSDPEKFIPGQKMWISVPDAVERQDIIAYLRAETAQK